ncbi:hypothetical protein [Pontibacter burrus]|uniref:Uncharacterized protein n=1 Tax=Pontibacter burrus TaxID=2704466 RepID=A0A6B3LWB8_9BACT|nr:hypothetical protein [Pontibacter burrus]NEM98178.1 hypothetical protein [Pontibacter burrus]
MRYLKLLTILSVLAITLTGCTILTNSFGYKETAENFVNAIMEENYDEAVSLMAMEHELAKGTDIENLKQGLGSLREMVAKNFGTQLTYTFVKTEKTFTTGDNKQIPNTTVLHLQLENEKEFGYFMVLFDDHSQKILNIQLQDVKHAIPGMATFWLFGVLVLAVLAFNIYMVVKVKKSNVTKKWRKYLAIILLNVPTIGWSAVGGFFFKLLNFQFMFGISFSMMGYLNSALAFGIPLGSLYELWKFKNGLYETTDYTATEAIS